MITMWGDVSIVQLKENVYEIDGLWLQFGKLVIFLCHIKWFESLSVSLIKKCKAKVYVIIDYLFIVLVCSVTVPLYFHSQLKC